MTWLGLITYLLAALVIGLPVLFCERTDHVD